MNANHPNAPENELPTLEQCGSGDCFCKYECERRVQGFDAYEEDDGFDVGGEG